MTNRKPEWTYDWSFEKRDGEEIVNCWVSVNSRQIIPGLWEVNNLSTFHDAELKRATKEINAILKKVRKSNKNRKRNLSLILFDNRMLLVWAHYGMIGPYDDRNKITKALGLKLR